MSLIKKIIILSTVFILSSNHIFAQEVKNTFHLDNFTIPHIESSTDKLLNNIATTIDEVNGTKNNSHNHLEKIKSKIESTYLGNLEFSLQSFTIDLKTGKFVSNQSLLNGNKLKQIKGAMEYVPPKSQPKHNNLFNFISYNTDAEITVNNNTKLITGVSIKEDLFYSSSLSGENAELYFLLKNNKKISVKSKSFLIDDSNISSANPKL